MSLKLLHVFYLFIYLYYIFILQLWDVEPKKRLRQMPGHAARVGCLSWNSHTLTRYFFETII